MKQDQLRLDDSLEGDLLPVEGGTDAATTRHKGGDEEDDDDEEEAATSPLVGAATTDQRMEQYSSSSTSAWTKSKFFKRCNSSPLPSPASIEPALPPGRYCSNLGLNRTGAATW